MQKSFSFTSRKFFKDFMLQVFSLVRYLKGPYSFVLYLQLLSAELDSATTLLALILEKNKHCYFDTRSKMKQPTLQVMF